MTYFLRSATAALVAAFLLPAPALVLPAHALPPTTSPQWVDDLEVSPISLSITTAHNCLNTFLSPYFSYVTALNATACPGNTLINPNYGGAVVNSGPLASGISVVGPSSRAIWLFPAAASYTASSVGDGLSISPLNASGKFARGDTAPG